MLTFFGSLYELLFTNLHSDFHPGVLVFVWVNPIHESTGISIDEYSGFFGFDVPLSTNLCSDLHTGVWTMDTCLDEPNLRIYGHINRHISGIFFSNVPLSMNLYSDSHTCLWVHACVNPIYKHTSILVTHILDFFVPYMNSYLRIYTLISMQMCLYLFR